MPQSRVRANQDDESFFAGDRSDVQSREQVLSERRHIPEWSHPIAGRPSGQGVRDGRELGDGSKAGQEVSEADVSVRNGPAQQPESYPSGIVQDLRLRDSLSLGFPTIRDRSIVSPYLSLSLSLPSPPVPDRTSE